MYFTLCVVYPRYGDQQSIAMTTIEQPANARSRRTRRALLDGARAILEEEGAAALTMAAVAERAGVTRRAAYLHFPSRADVVASLFDHIAEQQGLGPSLDHVFAASDSVAALDRWAEHLARYHPALIAVDRAITHAQRHDPDAAAHRERISTAQRNNCRRLARWLADEERLASPWTIGTATDMLFGLISTDMMDRLLHDCRWSPQLLASSLAALLRRTLVVPGSPASTA